MDTKKKGKKLHPLLPSQNTTNNYRPKQPTSSPLPLPLPPPECFQTQPTLPRPTTTLTSSKRMAFPSSSSSKSNLKNNSTSILFPVIAATIFLCSVMDPATAVSDSQLPVNQTFRPEKQLQRLKRVNAHLKKINKPAVKTIQAIILSCFTSFMVLIPNLWVNLQSADGDLIDCVSAHLQPAFDHPELRGQKPLEPPEARPGRNVSAEAGTETQTFQLWRESGESCPEGTIPIRRTTEKDILRATSIKRFGRKLTRRNVWRRDSTSTGHEHAVVFVNGERYYGAKASINVWAPQVSDQYEFSLSQVWLISGSFGNDLNTIEAGWQVSPELYGDNYPRFFTYWTTDAYQTTGCYNLLCSGFVQTNNKIAIGAAISPRSSYNGKQFDIGVTVWKDPKQGNWWLEFGSGLLIGYWPSFLFSHLRSHANMVQFGGEIVNTRPSGSHTSTQMGSGHFAGEGFKKASYFRNLQVVDWDNNLLQLKNFRVLADHPGCYDVQQGQNHAWGTYFYYGGPGRNVKCP